MTYTSSNIRPACRSIESQIYPITPPQRMHSSEIFLLFKCPGQELTHSLQLEFVDSAWSNWWYAITDFASIPAIAVFPMPFSPARIMTFEVWFLTESSKRFCIHVRVPSCHCETGGGIGWRMLFNLSKAVDLRSSRGLLYKWNILYLIL